jgi:hypothetical protein
MATSLINNRKFEQEGKFIKRAIQNKKKKEKDIKRTKTNKYYSNIKNNIQDQMNDDKNARLDAKEEQYQEKQDELDAFFKQELLSVVLNGETIVWSKHHQLAKEQEPLPISEDYYFGYSACHPVSDSDSDYDLWEGYDDYESFDQMLNPELYK